MEPRKTAGAPESLVLNPTNSSCDFRALGKVSILFLLTTCGGVFARTVSPPGDQVLPDCHLSRNKTTSSPLFGLLKPIGSWPVLSWKSWTHICFSVSQMKYADMQMWRGLTPVVSTGLSWDGSVKHIEMISWEFLKFGSIGERKGKDDFTSQGRSFTFPSARSVGCREMLETMGSSQWRWFIYSSSPASWYGRLPTIITDLTGAPCDLNGESCKIWQ